MKTIYALFALVIFTACNSTNDKMNALLSEKKITEDSLAIYNGIAIKEKELWKGTNVDTAARGKHLEATLRASSLAFNRELRLREIVYSIDSLSKLK